MKQAMIFGLIILAVIAAGAYFTVMSGGPISLPKNQEKGFEADVKLTGDESPAELQRIPNPDPSEVQNQGGSESGGGGGSSGSSQEESSTCTGPQISYSLGTFEHEENCNEFSGQTCIDKTLNCTVTLSNFDGVYGGEFGLAFTHYYLNGTTKITAATTNQAKSVDPLQTETVFSSAQVTGAQANEVFACTAITTSVPKKC